MYNTLLCLVILICLSASLEKVLKVLGLFIFTHISENVDNYRVADST